MDGKPSPQWSKNSRPLHLVFICFCVYLPLLVKVVRHVSGKPCYVHLKTRTCVWAPPYAVADHGQLETHSPPGVVRKALLSLPRGCSSDIKRQKHNPPAMQPGPSSLFPQEQLSVSPPQQQQPQPPPLPGAAGCSATIAAHGAAASGAAASAVGGGAPVGESVPSGRPATLPMVPLREVGPSGQRRAYHHGCPFFDIDITDKPPASILNEFCSKVLRCAPEFVVTTQEDPVNPYLTTIIIDGIVVARAGFSNKKMSRQVASRKALSILAPLMDIGSAAYDEGVAAVDTGGGVLGGVGATLQSLEAREVEALRLPLNDDRILENTVGKTPVMVLQEHCHKHVGKLPEYTDHVEAPGKLPVYRVTVGLYTGESCSACDTIKKRAKQRCALDLLRRLYPHVLLWGDLVESTNSRQREAKVRSSSGVQGGGGAAAQGGGAAAQGGGAAAQGGGAVVQGGGGVQQPGGGSAQQQGGRPLAAALAGIGVAAATHALSPPYQQHEASPPPQQQPSSPSPPPSQPPASPSPPTMPPPAPDGPSPPPPSLLQLPQQQLAALDVTDEGAEGGGGRRRRGSGSSSSDAEGVSGFGSTRDLAAALLTADVPRGGDGSDDEEEDDEHDEHDDDEPGGDATEGGSDGGSGDGVRRSSSRGGSSRGGSSRGAAASPPPTPPPRPHELPPEARAAGAPPLRLDRVSRQMLQVAKDHLWERIAQLNNQAAGRQVVPLSTEPIPLERAGHSA